MVLKTKDLSTYIKNTTFYMKFSLDQIRRWFDWIYSENVGMKTEKKLKMDYPEIKRL